MTPILWRLRPFLLSAYAVVLSLVGILGALVIAWAVTDIGARLAALAMGVGLVIGAVSVALVRHRS